MRKSRPCYLSLSNARQSGVALVAMLLALALLALAGQKVLLWVSVQVQRDAETELAFIGEEFVSAIRSYYLSPSGTRNELPPSLESLLLDHRKLIVTRHLRRIAVDPLTGDADWGVIHGRLLSAPFGLPESAVTNGKPVEGIVGVYSRSRRTPIRAVDAEGRPFTSYTEWLFTIPVDFTRIE